jgi:molybdopterin molybdotransferase
MFGAIGETAVLGLPGNPVSALVCGLIFLRPALYKLLAVAEHEIPRASARLAGALPENDRRQDYLRATLARGDDGALIADPFALQDSSMLSRLAQAGCLVLRPPHAPPAQAGDMVEIIPFEPGLAGF